MKMKLIALLTLSTFLAGAQSTIVMMDTLGHVLPSVINETVAPGPLSDPALTVIDYKNISTASHSYELKRYDVKLHASLQDTAYAYFCFGGSCTGSQVVVSQTIITLAPGQRASEVQGTFQMLNAELKEASDPGVSWVRYTIWNVSNHADSAHVLIRYNDNSALNTGVKAVSASSTAFDIYPSPVRSNATLMVSTDRDASTRLTIYNSLGTLVYQKEIALTNGKNKVDLQLSQLSSGIYFATLGDGITKKILVD